MASFDENGKYIKTDWKAGDKITATKLNKIEESIEAVNDNDISRHVEADARLDALEAKDVAHDKEFTNVKNLIADNKAAAELGDYEINSRMQFLEQELNEGIEEVHNVASTVDGKIATAEAKVAEVEADLEGLHAKDEELAEQVAHITHNKVYVKNFNSIQDAIESIENIGEFTELHFENKVYYENTINFVSNVKYVCNGATIISSNTSSSPILAVFENLSNFTVENLTLDGNLNINTVLKVANCTNYKFNNVKVEQALNYGGMDFSNTYGLYNECTFVNNKSNHFNHSGLLVNSTDLVFTNCKFNDNDGNGLRFDNFYDDNKNGCKFIKFSNCEANNNKQHGFLSNPGYLENKPNNITFNSCYANFNGDDNMYSGFATHYIDHLSLVGCMANGNKEHGIVLMDGLYATINSCICTSNGFSGIRLQGDFVRPQDIYTGVHNSILSNNIIENNGVYSLVSDINLTLCNGVTIGGNCTNIAIINNQIINNKGYVVRVQIHENYNNCTNIYINNNIVTGNKRETIPDNTFAFENNAYEDNIFGSNVVEGIEQSLIREKSYLFSVDCSDSNSTLMLNEVHDNYLITTDKNLIVNSLFVNSKDPGQEITLLFNQDTEITVTLCNGVAGNGLKVGKEVIVCDSSDVVKFIYDGNFWRLISVSSV